MDEKYFLVTEEFLTQTPLENFCTVCLEDADFLGSTAKEIGKRCAGDLLIILSDASTLGLTVLCSEEYDIFRLVQGNVVNEPFCMDPRYTEAVKNTLRVGAKLKAKLSIPIAAIGCENETCTGTIPEPGSQVTADADNEYERRFAELCARASAMDNFLSREKDGTIVYRRTRRKNPRPCGPQVTHRGLIFKAKDAHDPRQCHNNTRWFFNRGDLSKLAAAIEHDEGLYRQFYEC